jgi:hypothetical protein
LPKGSWFHYERQLDYRANLVNEVQGLESQEKASESDRDWRDLVIYKSTLEELVLWRHFNLPTAPES